MSTGWNADRSHSGNTAFFIESPYHLHMEYLYIYNYNLLRADTLLAIRVYLC